MDSGARVTPDVTTRSNVLGDQALDAVKRGLAGCPATISSKYFYDQRGSELFEAITELPEYYPTRAERSLLERHAGTLIEAVGACSLVELGAGSGVKTRLLLQAMSRSGGRTYVPVDVSGEFLGAAARQLREEFPAIDIHPLAADFTGAWSVPGQLERPAMFALLGSTIGNFDHEGATAVLRSVRAQMQDDDRLLLGVDLRKSVATLEAAYNDTAGVTAAFNRNALVVLNERFGATFNPALWDHRAFYNPDAHRIEMWLYARAPETVQLRDGTTFHFAAGEGIRTEISCKYDRPAVASIFEAAGLRLRAWETGESSYFALALGSCQ